MPDGTDLASSCMYRTGLGSHAELRGCYFHDLRHNGQLGMEGHRLRVY